MTNLNAAIETATRKAAGTVWAKSVAKAASALVSGQLIVTVLVGNGNGVVSSANGTYRITRGFCSCPARVNHCYHVSALRIVELAEETPADERAALVADIKAATKPIELSAWLQRRFGHTLITSRFIPIQTLRQIHEALA